MHRFAPSFVRALAPVALAATLFSPVACSDDDVVTPTGTIGVTLGQTSATLARGGTIIVPVTVSRSNYSGAIALTAEGVPSGVTATFDPASVASGSSTANLTLTADNNAAAATTDITVRATGTGVNAQTVILPLTISNTTAAGITLGTVTTLSTAQGATGSIPILITRNGGYTGAVDLTVEGLPAGVTATYAQPQLASGARVTTLTFNTTSAATASATAVPVTIRAAGTGIPAQTSTVNLTVTPSTTSGFGTSLAPAAFAVTAGQSATSTLTVARQNSFAGNVSFTLEGAPAGVTATLTPNPVTAGTAAVTIATTAAVAPGVYQMTLKGTGTGVTDYSTPITLIVN